VESINIDIITKTSNVFVMEKFTNACNFVKSIIPGFQVKYKNQSLLMKIVGVFLWPFNRIFMTHYVTTLKWTVYFPTEESIRSNPESAVETLMHEFIHMWDRKQKGVWFSVGYLSPQIWAIVPFVGLTAFGWLFPIWIDCFIFGLGMLCLAPWPSPWRTGFELRGYTVTLAYKQWTHGVLASSEGMGWIEKQFTGWYYYKMWPCKNSIANRIDKIIEEIRANKLEIPFVYVKTFLETKENGHDQSKS
jgi:hypothetical protein